MRVAAVDKQPLTRVIREALSRGAAIAFYTVTSLAPVLLIVIAIAGLVFGQEAAQNAIMAQLSGLMGQQTAEVLQTAIASAAGESSGIQPMGTAALSLRPDGRLDQVEEPGKRRRAREAEEDWGVTYQPEGRRPHQPPVPHCHHAGRCPVSPPALCDCARQASRCRRSMRVARSSSSRR
jgi:hypothetical protein